MDKYHHTAIRICKRTKTQGPRAGTQEQACKKKYIFKNTKDRLSIIVDVCVLWQLMGKPSATRMIGQLNVTESAKC